MNGNKHLRANLLRRTLVIVICTLILSFLAGTALSAPPSKGGGKSDLPLKLTASPDKSEYAKGELVQFKLRLENISKVPVTVCLSLVGIVHPESFTVNGVAATRMSAFTSDMLPAILEWDKDAVVLQPGEGAEFTDGLDPVGNQLRGYTDVIVTPGSGTGKKFRPGRIDTFIYVPPGYGTYRLKVFYSYIGPEFPNLPLAARGKIVSNEILFTMQ
jgi:hypothetical protein